VQQGPRQEMAGAVAQAEIRRLLRRRHPAYSDRRGRTEDAGRDRTAEAEAAARRAARPRVKLLRRRQAVSQPAAPAQPHRRRRTDARRTDARGATTGCGAPAAGAAATGRLRRSNGSRRKPRRGRAAKAAARVSAPVAAAPAPAPEPPAPVATARTGPLNRLQPKRPLLSAPQPAQRKPVHQGEIERLKAEAAARRAAKAQGSTRRRSVVWHGGRTMRRVRQLLRCIGREGDGYVSTGPELA